MGLRRLCFVTRQRSGGLVRRPSSRGASMALSARHVLRRRRFAAAWLWGYAAVRLPEFTQRGFRQCAPMAWSATTCALNLRAQRCLEAQQMAPKVGLPGSSHTRANQRRAILRLPASSGRLCYLLRTASLGSDRLKTRTRFNLSLTCRRYFELARPCK